MKEPPLRTSCGGGSFVLRNVREGQPSDPATTTSSDCGAERGTWLAGPFVPVAVSRRGRETTRYFRRGIADSDGLERYGCKREVVVGVVLFHKLIETECHIDWNVQDFALFAEVLAA